MDPHTKLHRIQPGLSVAFHRYTCQNWLCFARTEGVAYTPRPYVTCTSSLVSPDCQKKCSWSTLLISAQYPLWSKLLIKEKIAQSSSIPLSATSRAMSAESETNSPSCWTTALSVSSDIKETNGTTLTVCEQGLLACLVWYWWTWPDSLSTDFRCLLAVLSTA